MREIKTLELQLYRKFDEHRVIEDGVMDPGEIFERLNEHLEEEGLLPDEYFIPDFNIEHLRPGWKEMQYFSRADCKVNFGGSEGIYLSITLECDDKKGRSHIFPLATGKTLGETADDFIRMSRIAGECTMFLNGDGAMLRQENVYLTLTPRELDILCDNISLTLAHDYGNSGASLYDKLSAALKKEIDSQPVRKSTELDAR